MRRLLVGLLFATIVSLIFGCSAKVGERCDGFFANGCDYPGMCVEADDRSVCAVSCEVHTEMELMGQKYCETEGWQMVEVTAELGSVSGAMGCYCVPPP